jgi:hypothetical protein
VRPWWCCGGNSRHEIWAIDEDLLWIALGMPVALALLVPDLVPQLEFDSISLPSSHTVYRIVVAAIVPLLFTVARPCSGEVAPTASERSYVASLLPGAGFARGDAVAAGARRVPQRGMG